MCEKCFIKTIFLIVSKMINFKYGPMCVGIQKFSKIKTKHHLMFFHTYLLQYDKQFHKAVFSSELIKDHRARFALSFFFCF